MERVQAAAEDFFIRSLQKDGFLYFRDDCIVLHFLALWVIENVTTMTNPSISEREFPMKNQMTGFKGWMINRGVSGLISALAFLCISGQSQAAVPNSLPNGTYLYGESDQPNQAGATYFVFDVKEGEVKGAVYSPNSNFDCAYGRFENDQLLLNIVSTYEKTVNPFAIALDRTSLIASSVNAPMIQVGLHGLKSVGRLSDLDRHILATCEASKSFH